MSAAKHSVSVAAAVVREDGKVLVVRRRDNGQWEPPGGVLEFDERIEDGVRREVAEETGLEIEVERLTGVYKNLSRGIVALVFRARCAGGALAESSESTDFRWLEPDHVREWVEDVYAVRLLDALSSHERPAVRDHDGQQLDSRARRPVQPARQSEASGPLLTNHASAKTRPSAR